MDSILVTGGAGYIGSHTIIELLARNFEVISIDNFSNSSPDTYRRIEKISGKKIRTIQADLCNKKEFFGAMQNLKVSGIIHFAALKSVPESVAHPLMYYHNNVESLVNVLEYAQLHKAHNFIFSSSCSVYGNADHLPVTEKTALKKSESPYGHTKQIGEEICSALCSSNSHFRSVLLRYFNPVGAHMSGEIGELPMNRPNNLVPIITQTAVGKNKLTVFGNNYNTRDGSCIRDYVHVCDIARAHVQALDYLKQGKNKNAASVFNLGTGHGVSVFEAISSFEKISGMKLPYQVGPRREGDVEAIFADNQLARTELGWNPVHSLDDMMLSAWKWQQNLEKEQ